MTGDLSPGDFARLFETVDEVSAPVQTETIGKLPMWLKGSVARAGPGKFEFGSHSYEHWFDGMCILHKFTINRGEVSYSSRFLESKTFLTNSASNKIIHSGFGTVPPRDPYDGIFKRFGTLFSTEEESDNVNVNVCLNGPKLMAVGDSRHGYVVNPDNLSTERAAQLPLVDIATSHPHQDCDGSTYNIGSTYRQGRPAYHVIKILPPLPGDTGDENWRRAKILASMPSRSTLGISYYHSFGLTENYVIFYEGPVFIDFLKVLKCALWRTAINEAFRYHKKEKGYFHIFHKRTGEKLKVKITTDGYFFWHVINAYETEDGIIFDACVFKNFDRRDLFALPLNDIKTGSYHDKARWRKFQHFPARFRLPLQMSAGQKSETGSGARGCEELHIVPERLLPEGQDRIDMPTINYKRCNGQKYRYFYGTGSIVKSWYFNSVGKVDVDTQTVKLWKGTGTQFPSEAIFVENPHGETEDDGVLLVSVCDVHPEKRDFLLCLDAATFTELARSYVPEGMRVPYSLHGSFYSHSLEGAPATVTAL